MKLNFYFITQETPAGRIGKGARVEGDEYSQTLRYVEANFPSLERNKQVVNS